MTFNETNPVVVGAATKKSDYDTVFDNTLACSRLLYYEANEDGVGNVGAGVDTLMSYPIPALTFGPNRGVRITAAGAFEGNANNKTLTVNFGGFLLTGRGPAAFSGLGWVLTAEGLVKTAGSGLSTLVWSANLCVGFEAAARVALLPIDFTIPNTLQITGEGVADDDIKQYILMVELIP